MADNVMARQDGEWIVISLMPDVCRTPMGSSTPPVPYPVTTTLDGCLMTSSDVRANGDPVVRYNSSFIPTTKGDEAGTATGVVSGTVGGKCRPKGKSTSVRVNGEFVVRHDDEFWMNGG